MKATIHEDNITQNKQKIKAKFGCLLRTLVRKRRRSYSCSSWYHI